MKRSRLHAQPTRPRRTPPRELSGFRSRARFLRNRRAFGVVITISLFASLVLAGAVTAAPAGPLLLWTMDDGSGVVVSDTSGSGLDGSVVGTGATWVSGPSGDALEFTGDDDAVEFLDPTDALAIDADNALSLSAWVRMASPPGPTVDAVVAQRRDPVGGAGYRLAISGPTGRPMASLFDPAETTITSTSSISDGTWHHLVLTISPTTLSFYVDGALDGATPIAPTTILDGAPFLVGQAPAMTSATDFDGAVDHVFVYDTTLSAVEVVDLYDDLVPPPPAGLVVNSTGDAADTVLDGICDTGGINAAGDTECTLRAAIEEAESKSGEDAITFNIPASDPNHVAGVWTISPTVELPWLEDLAGTDIDARTQPGYAGNPVIELDGSGLVSSTAAILLRGTGNEVFGFAIHSFPDEAIETQGDGGGGNFAIVQANWIGLDALGTVLGNVDNGVLLTTGSADNLIGGPNPADGNVIVGHNYGVEIRELGSDRNVVTNNHIGVLPSSTAAPNALHGVYVWDTAVDTVIGPGNTIRHNGADGVNVDLTAGLSTSVQANDISDNTGLGIDISADGATANDSPDADGFLNTPVVTNAAADAGTMTVYFDVDTVAGNYVAEFFANPTGTDPSGSGEGHTYLGSFPFSHGGGLASYQHDVSGAVGDVVTATLTAGTPGNTGDTSEFSNAFTAVDAVARHIVNSTGDATDANLGDDVCDTGSLNALGAPECTLQAAIAEANSGTIRRIEFGIPTADAGHTVGVWTIQQTTEMVDVVESISIDGSTQPGWVDDPVIVLDGATSAGLNGIEVEGPNGAASSISELSIVNFTQSGLGIGVPDVTIDGLWLGLLPDGSSAGNGIGASLYSNADDAVLTNVVASGNSSQGIRLQGGGVSGVRIDGSFIGTTPDGLFDRANGGSGIEIVDSTGSRIGEFAPTVIASNLGWGIEIDGGDGTWIMNTNIGVDATGSSALGNANGGVRVDGGANNVWIGRIAEGGNVISANGGPGVTDDGSGTALRVSDSFIGTNAAGDNLGNLGHGVHVVSSTGTTLVARSTISHNGGDGVRVEPTMTSTTGVTYSTFFNNGGLAIDLNGDGVTPNDPGDVDSGPNTLLNHPVILDITEPGPTINYRLDAPADNYVVQFFRNPGGVDPSGSGEAQALVTLDVITHPGGSVDYSHAAAGVVAGERITAYVFSNGTNGNQASEFSAPALAVFGIEVNSTGDLSDATPGDGLCDTGGLNATAAPECTLRAAIAESNALPGADTITFDVPAADPGHGGGLWTISPATRMTGITDEVTIDATTQAGYAGRPVVELDGGALTTPSNQNGLTFDGGADDSTLRGLSIVGHPGAGVSILADDVTLVENFVGLDVGLFPDANANGVLVSGGATGTTIGTSWADGNVISGNAGHGISIDDESPSTRIDGNRIGVDQGGDGAVPNGGNGINLQHADATWIGVNATNVVSANVGHGIRVSGSAVSTRIEQNHVGVNASETAGLGNGLDGIVVEAGVNDTAIGSTAGTGNIVGGNGGNGVTLTGTHTQVQQSWIGTDSTRTQAIPNGGWGISLDEPSGIAVLETNRIDNNALGGIRVLPTTPNVRIAENELRNNGGVAIDLGPAGPTSNDPGDGDIGTNGLLNYPVVTAATEVAPNDFELTVDLDAPADAYTAVVYRNPDGTNQAEVVVQAVPIAHGGGVATHTLPIGTIPPDSTLTIQLFPTAGPNQRQGSEMSAPFTVAGSIVVNSTGDAPDVLLGDGVCDTGSTNALGAPECTLRAAIREANISATLNAIAFDIPAADTGHTGGVWTLTPTTPLPSLGDTVLLDATTQSGYVATPVVVIDGSAQAAGVDGIMLNTGSDGSIVRGFSIVNMPDAAIWDRTTGSSIVGNWLGVRPDGSAGGNDDGIALWDGANGTTVGGAGSDANVIANNNRGIRLFDPTTTDARIDGNLIGTLADGLTPAPNATGIRVDGIAGAQIGTVTPNVISGNAGDGIELVGTNANITIQDNLIGVGLDGTTPVGNGGHGISASGTSSALTTANTIGHNTLDGISLTGGAGVRVTSQANRFIDNGDLPFDINDDGVTPSDVGDPDVGPNGVLNRVRIVNIAGDPANASVLYNMDVPTGSYTVQFYESDTPDPTDSGEGEVVLEVDIESSFGLSKFASATGVTTTPGRYLSAQITDNATGDSSELAAPVLIERRNQIADPGTVATPEGSPITIDLVGTPGGAAPLVWSATGLPDGVTINPVSGQITGPVSYDAAGSHSVTVTASSADALPGTVAFTWIVSDVNRDPTITAIAPQTTEVGVAVDLTPVGSDPDGDALTWSATGLPAGLSIDPGTGRISGTAAGPPGTSAVTVTITDPSLAFASSTFTWTVSPPTTTTTTTTSTTTTTAAPTTTATTTTTTTTTPTSPNATTTSTTTTTTSIPATTIVDEPSTTSETPTVPTSVPSSLPLAALSASDDAVAARTDQPTLVRILENDVFFGMPTIIIPTQPEIGSATVVSGGVEVSLPPSFSGNVTFEYVLIDADGQAAEATVTVYSLNVLSPAAGAPSEPDTITSLDDVFSRVSSLFVGLIEIELSTLQLTVLAIAPLVFIVLSRMFRREIMASVTGISRSSWLPLTIGDRHFNLRHDALVWYDPKSIKLKRGRKLVRVRSDSGVSTWVDQAHLVDTGF